MQNCFGANFYAKSVAKTEGKINTICSVVAHSYFISFFNFLVVCLILNFQLFKVNQVKTFCQFFLYIQLFFLTRIISIEFRKFREGVHNERLYQTAKKNVVLN